MYCLGKAYDDLDNVLDEFATKIHNLISNLDFHIREFETDRGIPRNASVTKKIKFKDGLPSRKTFLRTFAEGRSVWKEFEDSLNKIRSDDISKKITQLMDSHFSISANHVGVSPSEFVVPGGTKQSGFRGTHKDMKSRNDVINMQEVSKFKFDREDDLYDRLVNLQNHYFHHRCSAYLTKGRRINWRGAVNWKEDRPGLWWIPNLQNKRDL